MDCKYKWVFITRIHLQNTQNITYYRSMSWLEIRHNKLNHNCEYHKRLFVYIM